MSESKKKKQDVICVKRDDAAYPSSLTRCLSDQSPQAIYALGNLDILQAKPLALFSSVKCPGDIILKTYDLAQSLRQKGITVIGGFHSPMEKECLTILLRGTQPVIVCPAKSIDGMPIPAAYRKPLEQGRLLLISPFDNKQRRTTAQSAYYRNRFIAALAEKVFIVYAEPLGKTEQICKEVMELRKKIYTFESNHNKNARMYTV
ncbi:MAG: DNA-processing protein DprA [Nitrospirota bacterium]